MAKVDPDFGKEMWQVMKRRMPEGYELHVVPEAGPSHDCIPNCWCGPKVETYGKNKLFSHNMVQ